MHSPRGGVRADSDAFDVRSNLSVEDACVTSLSLVRVVVAQLDLLASNNELSGAHREAVRGIACLGRLACGAVGVVDSALRDQPPAAPSRAEAVERVA